MTETNNSFTVFRRQVIQTGEYEPAEASCSVTITLNGDEDSEAVAGLISEWGTTLEMANYEALGVGYELTEQGVRRLSKAFPGLTRQIPWLHQPRRIVPPVVATTRKPTGRTL